MAIDAQRNDEVRHILQQRVRPLLETLPEPQRSRIIRLCDDLTTVL